MGYKEIAAEAKAKKVSVDLTPTFFQFKDEGDSIVGRYLSASPVQGKKNAGTYLQYVFDTDDGAVEFHCGGQFDTRVGARMTPGKIYSITFLGKRDLEGGHRVNDFEAVEIPDPMAR